jgi:hypothetical protein
MACEERSKRVLAVVKSFDSIRYVGAGSSLSAEVDEKIEILSDRFNFGWQNVAPSSKSATALDNRSSEIPLDERHIKGTTLKALPNFAILLLSCCGS